MKWGIIGAGNIAKRFAQSQSHIENSCIYAISARNHEKREKFKETYGVQHAYSTPLEVLEDTEVEAVYIALPHHLHYEWCKEAILHHKAVFVEKPACLHTQEIEELLTLAKQEKVLFMEGMKSLLTPAYRAFKENDLDNIHSIEVQTGFVLPEKDRGYTTSKECGGCLYDMGIYALGVLSDLCKGDMHIDSLHTDFEHDVDFHEDIHMTIGNCKVHMICSFKERLSKAIIHADTQSYVLDPIHRPLVCNGTEYPYVVDDFYGEIEHFIYLYNHNITESPIVTYTSMYNHIHWMEEIHEKMKEG